MGTSALWREAGDLWTHDCGSAVVRDQEELLEMGLGEEQRCQDGAWGHQSGISVYL